MTVTPIEILALKKLAMVCHALALKLTGTARTEQLTLTRVLVDVIAKIEKDAAP